MLPIISDLVKKDSLWRPEKLNNKIGDLELCINQSQNPLYEIGVSRIIEDIKDYIKAYKDMQKSEADDEKNKFVRIKKCI